MGLNIENQREKIRNEKKENSIERRLRLDKIKKQQKRMFPKSKRNLKIAKRKEDSEKRKVNQIKAS